LCCHEHRRFNLFGSGFAGLGNPDLSVEDALDVAVFVTTGPRPHFTEKTKQGG
jgi:cytochrome c